MLYYEVCNGILKAVHSSAEVPVKMAFLMVGLEIQQNLDIKRLPMQL